MPHVQITFLLLIVVLIFMLVLIWRGLREARRELIRNVAEQRAAQRQLNAFVERQLAAESLRDAP